MKSRLLFIIGLIAALVVVGVIAIWQISRTPPAAPPAVAVLPDVETIRTQAESGDTDAQYQLGKLYAKGLGVKEDYKLAAKWYRVLLIIR